MIPLCRFTLFVVLFLSLSVFPLSSAGQNEEETAQIQENGLEREPPKAVTPAYAELFSAEKREGYTLVTVHKPWAGASRPIRYALYPRETAPPDPGSGQIPAGTYPIEVPVRSVVSMSSTFISQLEILGMLDRLVGCDRAGYIYSEEVQKRIEAGKIVPVGSGSSVDIERLIALDPDLILTSSIGSESDIHPKLMELGLPVVVNADWVENSPLGRSEWIRFVSLFFGAGAESEAERVFERIEKEYNRLKSLADKAAPENRPKVLINAPYQGTWSVPGGRSFAARFIRDAGGNYLWSENTSEGSLFLDIEAVYSRAMKADVWINLAYGWKSVEDVTSFDPRFANLPVVQKRELYNNNARISDQGANDYWESGLVQPQRILADLITIFHPKLLPDHELIYYHRLGTAQ